MYCPTCAAQNIDSAHFCRGCGADISFLSKATIRGLPEKEQLTAEKGLRYTFIGAGFLITAIVMALVAPPPANWALCFSMLCAAFPLLGSGIAMTLHVKRYQQNLASGAKEPEKLMGQPVGQLPARNTSEMIQPNSITEGTTKTLRVPSDGEN
ncbi:MAG: zinc ribbon domain-containing protein [Acidobacteriota bacterium]|nr:zinc ribbon domain-containing protein [Acidobacteriota bacterium]